MSMDAMSAYERARLANIERNRRHLEALGLGKAARRSVQQVRPRKKPPRKKPPRKKPPRKRARKEAPPNPNPGNRRVSRRLRGEAALSAGLSHDWEELQDEDGAAGAGGATETKETKETKETRWPARPLSDRFGALPGIACGFKFDSRADGCASGVHRATVAGIVGHPDVGCYSIVLNGGYADDVDEGTHLTYTGSGGRSLRGTSANPKNLRTGPHTKHQTMEGNEGKKNRALKKSLTTGQPVRVLRGYKLDSKFAPLGIDYGGDVNYRYDGLYRVVKMWTSVGIDHPFNVFKFALVRFPASQYCPFERTWWATMLLRIIMRMMMTIMV